MELSVVMPVRNQAHLVLDQLDALARQDAEPGWELVVVDNASSDATVKAVESRAGSFDELRLVHAAGAAGPAHARNVGVAAARGDVLLFCDADDIVGDGWLAAMSSAFEEGAVMAAGPLDSMSLNSEFWWRQRRDPQAHGPQHQGKRPPNAAGANFAVHRDVFEAVGGFDESLTNFSDTDFCWRAGDSGFELAWVPDAVVRYRYRDTVRDVFSQAASYARAGMILAERYDLEERTVRPWYREALSVTRLLVESPILFATGHGARVIWRWGSLWGRLSRRLRAVRSS